jgi:hypothetical protein
MTATNSAGHSGKTASHHHPGRGRTAGNSSVMTRKPIRAQRHRGLLLPALGFQAHRHALRQIRPKLLLQRVPRRRSGLPDISQLSLDPKPTNCGIHDSSPKESYMISSMFKAVDIARLSWPGVRVAHVMRARLCQQPAEPSRAAAGPVSGASLFSNCGQPRFVVHHRIKGKASQ